MAWARIDDAALNHPKLIGLSDKAFRLWVWGLTYCQRYLTDGVIPVIAIPPHLKSVTGVLVAAVLWEAGVDGGYVVHHYLQWNDSKALIERKRQEAKHRMSAVREKRSREHHRENSAQRTSHEVLRGVDLSSDLSFLDQKRVNGNFAPISADPLLDPVITERAGRFIEQYERLYPLHRKGARYTVRPGRDYEAAVTLCRTWPDDARLEKLAICFLTTDHKFAAEGSRTIPQFLALASWADGELATWEAGKR